MHTVCSPAVAELLQQPGVVSEQVDAMARTGNEVKLLLLLLLLLLLALLHLPPLQHTLMQHTLMQSDHITCWGH
jgi:hypothetical protein